MIVDGVVRFPWALSLSTAACVAFSVRKVRAFTHSPVTFARDEPVSTLKRVNTPSKGNAYEGAAAVAPGKELQGVQPPLSCAPSGATEPTETNTDAAAAGAVTTSARAATAIAIARRPPSVGRLRPARCLGAPPGGKSGEPIPHFVGRSRCALEFEGCDSATFARRPAAGTRPSPPRAVCSRSVLENRGDDRLPVVASDTMTGTLHREQPGTGDFHG